MNTSARLLLLRLAVEEASIRSVDITTDYLEGHASREDVKAALRAYEQASDLWAHAAIEAATSARAHSVHPPVYQTDHVTGRRQELCAWHDPADPIPMRVCGRPLPCTDHPNYAADLAERFSS